MRHISSSSRLTKALCSHQIFVLAVWLTFDSVGDRDSWLAAWAPLASWVQQHEPATLTFQASVADTDPLKIMVFERYLTKDAYLSHRTTDAFKAFKAQQEHMNLKPSISGQSYYEMRLGFNAR